VLGSARTRVADLAQGRGNPLRSLGCEKLEPDKVKPDSFEVLIAKLEEIRASLIKLESDFPKLLSSVHPAWRKSADNLLHYLALRHHHIRLLQEKLAVLGLSSLGRSESHVMSTIDAVLNALHHLDGRPLEVPPQAVYAGFDEGKALLAANTESLLGPAPTRRGVRIMVTMSTEAADDYSLVHELVSRGMNCMRINCAHDTPEVWARMVGHLERARRELALPCRILMDLAGPKLRTGPVEPGPQVIVWHPKRDRLGRVVDPARIWLAPRGTPGGIPAGAAAWLPVSAKWLATVQSGDQIHFKDARDKRRFLEVVEVSGAGRWAECDQTAYVIPDTVLSRVNADEHAGRETKVGPLPPLQQSIVLRKGDSLIVTRDPVPGKPARLDAAGRTLSPAVISCTLPEIFPQVRVGETVWLDDGKIGGIIRQVQ
jgi:pyruvate kinase